MNARCNPVSEKPVFVIPAFELIGVEGQFVCRLFPCPASESIVGKISSRAGMALQGYKTRW